MARKISGRSDQLRAAIAQEAARIMEEHGIQDFFTAKNKAAERFAMYDAAVLPKNSEIEAALVARQRLFGGEQHDQTLAVQRRVALAAMQMLAKFEPRLVGAVLSGSATEHADIQLHLFSDSAETVFFELMDRRIAYEVIERRVKMNADRQVGVPGATFMIDRTTIEALVFPTDGIRQAPVSPVDGRPMRRASVTEVSQLTADAKR
ncbi:hypothetical protein EON77_09290 [bacterium]|nr:MAG: hypothetical protein EON77_09290 [bacterium]